MCGHRRPKNKTLFKIEEAVIVFNGSVLQPQQTPEERTLAGRECLLKGSIFQSLHVVEDEVDWTIESLIGVHIQTHRIQKGNLTIYFVS